MPFDPATPLRVEQISPKTWRLLDPLSYTGKVDVFQVPGGFVTDFASVPRLVTWLVPTSGEYSRAAVLHDFLCEVPGFPRNDADGIFRRALGELGVPTVRRYVMWGAVRVASLLRGARVVDVLGILLLALVVLPLAIPGAFYVLVVLSVLFLVEVATWGTLRLLGKKPSSGPVRFWWT
jgi:hypothetical protein